MAGTLANAASILADAAKALAGKRVDFLSLRGPAPPYFVCTECGSQTDDPWPNPILLSLKKLGHWQGETTGGYGACPACEPAMMARFEKKAPGPRTVIDVPKQYASVTMADLLTQPGRMTAIEAGYRFLADGAEHDLYVCGPVGAGKTYLACAIANEIVQQQPSVQFVRVHTLLLKLQQAMHDPNEGAHLTEYAAVGLLVLDDVGVEKGSDFSRRTLQTLYDMRRDAGRRTIWTSNLDLEKLSAFLDDDRLPSRIAGAADVVWLEGDDLRVTGRQAVDMSSPV